MISAPQLDQSERLNFRLCGSERAVEQLNAPRQTPKFELAA